VLDDYSRFYDPAKNVEVDLVEQNTDSTMAYWDGVNPHVRRSVRNRVRERKLEREGGDERIILELCDPLLTCVITLHRGRGRWCSRLGGGVAASVGHHVPKPNTLAAPTLGPWGGAADT
jgi:hypothetical protein